MILQTGEEQTVDFNPIVHCLVFLAQNACFLQESLESERYEDDFKHLYMPPQKQR